MSRTLPLTVLYTAAHSGFDLSQVPLGGAAAVCAQLSNVWQQNKTFDLRVLGPGVLGALAPVHKDLVHFTELQYARFCRDFEKASTHEILRYDPVHTVVLSNDISEGPNFRLLSERGYRIVTLYHVDVVDYFARMYLRSWVKPETAVALYDKWENSALGALVPNLLKLVFEKQRDSVMFSRSVVVPSEAMKLVVHRCYPEISAERILVIPWGSWEEPLEEASVQREAAILRVRYQIPDGSPVILTLSRISPEKGQDRLLKALKLWESEPDYPPQGVWLFVCGEAAYMQGKVFQKTLEKLAKRLKRTRVVFTGYLSGLQKQAHFRLAQLYVFPSRHESYGLTLLEAFRAGLPALATFHYGAEDLMKPEFGVLLPPASEATLPKLLKNELQRLCLDSQKLSVMGQRARVFAEERSFTQAALHIANLLQS